MVVLAAAMALPAALRADDASEALESARKAYEESNYTEAISQIDFASTLIRQKKSEAVAKFMPAAPSGWNAEEVETQGTGQALLGGMVGAKRRYQRESGGSLSIEIQSDSPLIQSFMQLFSNPVLLGSNGSKLETIRGQKIVVGYKTADKQGDVKAIVDGRYLISIEGSDVTREELLAFAKSVDFKALGALR